MPGPYPRLSKAPIVEAVIELKVTTGATVDPEALLTACTSLKPRFPISKALHSFKSELQISQGKPRHELQTAQAGYRLESEDKKYVAQLRTDGVAVSRLAPYTHWEDLRTVTTAVWLEYSKAIAIQAISRLGVRFINRIELRDEIIDFDRKLTAGPKIPPTMPQELAEFVTRLVVPVPEKDCSVAIFQTFEPGVFSLGKVTFPALVLDIDAFSEKTCQPNEQAIWTALEGLRDAKNMAFFESITQETLKQLI